MSCLELTIVKLEIYSNLLVAHTFVCRLLICFLSDLIIFISVKRANTVSGDEVLPKLQNCNLKIFN